MSVKRVLFDSAAREKVLKGATQLADAVRVTLGPKSKSVLIQKKWGIPLVCNDGVTIAKELDLEDPGEALGAQMLRQAAVNTGDADRMMRSEGALGFDASCNEYVDLIEAGIVDATKVVRIGLENAVSVASVLLLTEATMTEVPEESSGLPAQSELPM